MKCSQRLELRMTEDTSKINKRIYTGILVFPNKEH